MKRIARLEAGNWVNPREWSRYRSQRSEPIALKAGRAYYIEALQEQLLQDDHIAGLGRAVAQSVIKRGNT